MQKVKMMEWSLFVFVSLEEKSQMTYLKTPNFEMGDFKVLIGKFDDCVKSLWEKSRSEKNPRVKKNITKFCSEDRSLHPLPPLTPNCTGEVISTLRIIFVNNAHSFSLILVGNDWETLFGKFSLFYHINVLTYFMPLVSFYASWKIRKPEVFWCF